MAGDCFPCVKCSRFNLTLDLSLLVDESQGIAKMSPNTSLERAALSSTVRKHVEASALEVGRTYYQLTFADRDMTMPGVEPWVFIGSVELEEGGSAFAFQDAGSYVRYGSLERAREK